MKIMLDTNQIFALALWVWRSRAMWFVLGCLLGTVGYVILMVRAFSNLFGSA